MPAKQLARLLAVAMVLPLLAGCLSERQRAVLMAQPQNRVFDPAKARLGLPAGQAVSLAEWDRSGTQDIVLLQLAPDARLDKRYHKGHDLTLVIARGTAIVTVEESRYFVGPGATVFLPRLTAYSVIPQKAEDGTGPTTVAALLIFTPPYDPEDVHLVK